MKPNIIIFNPDQMRADALGKFKLEVQARKVWVDLSSGCVKSTRSGD